MTIRVSSPQVEGIFQASKWLKVQVLLDSEEMKALLLELGDVHFAVVSEPTLDPLLSPDAFLEKYAQYVHLLQEGQEPNPQDFRRYFSAALTTTLEALYAIAVGEKVLVKPIQPVIQLQAHHFFYSALDGNFYPMVFGEESISWGLQFSYPQLFQDPHTRQINKVSRDFPNSIVFSKLMKWMRTWTLPTPFEVNQKRVNVPIRIGKKALAWISKHPQLQKKSLYL